ncbi:MAG: hypothetical protein JXA57_10215 [Armatimonadetes bacterium]|nr:hypothetical protein [Armatimonadota bacterium]
MDRSRIGIDRALHLDWLDAAAGLAANGATCDTARTALLEVLGRELSSGGSRSAADKTASVLLRTWFKIPAEAAPLRKDATLAMRHADGSGRLAAHWSMLLAAYPFFIDCTSVAGRLLRLSGGFQRSEYSRRVAELWGEKPTANRASGRVLETLVALGVLRQEGAHCTQTGRFTVDGPAAAMLAEGLLLGEDRMAVPVESVSSHAAMFPFEMPPIATAVVCSSRLGIEVRGGDTEMLVRTPMK